MLTHMKIVFQIVAVAQEANSILLIATSVRVVLVTCAGVISVCK